MVLVGNGDGTCSKIMLIGGIIHTNIGDYPSKFVPKSPAVLNLKQREVSVKSSYFA